jgi:Formyl transferase
MHVGLITYQRGHLKTFQMMRRLMTKGFRITLFAFPFIVRQPKPNAPVKRVFEDRPAQLIDYDVPAFCARYGIGYQEVGGWTDDQSGRLDGPNPAAKPDVFLTCIGKIIPAAFIAGRTILNCHPGLLPQNRGVDAFKWCVLKGWPIGITLHIINEKVDSGIILQRVRVPILETDTFRDVCLRAYDLDGDLMANFDYVLGNAKFNWQVGDEYPLSKRFIPLEADQKIEKLFLERRAELRRLSVDPNAHSHPADRWCFPEHS